MFKMLLLIVCPCVVLGLMSSSIRVPAESLSKADLRVAVGACEGVGVLQEVKCNIQSIPCGAPPCADTSWTSACIGVNADKANGAGTKKITTIQCTNTYNSGPCQEVVGCVADAATSMGLTCGDKGQASDCGT